MGFGSNNRITLGNGAKDLVNNNGRTPGGNNAITLGDGSGDVVNDFGSNETITVGNGSDRVTAGADSIITLGNGAGMVTAVSSLINGGHSHDTFVFTGSFGEETVTNFNPQHDNIVLAQAMFANSGRAEAYDAGRGKYCDRV